MGRHGFYLKVDKGSRLAMDNLVRWVKTVSLLEGDCYILCDRDDVVQKARETLSFSDAVSFIKSERESEEIAAVVRGVIPPKGMVNAGIAHLTTFLHARSREYDFFWNIDADDTRFCLSAERTAGLLERAGGYAEENELDCFSLDMHTSRTAGQHWSFGVTYTRNRRDWLPILFSHANDRGYQEKDLGLRFNIDWYFTYIRSLGELKIETFYFENLKFIHYHFENMFQDLCIWGILHWKDNELRFPMMEAFSSRESGSGRCLIPDGVVGLELGIDDREAESVMLFQGDWGGFVERIDFDYLASKKALRHMREAYLNQYGQGAGGVACWGYGACFKKLFPIISQICPVAYVCDSDEGKWGEEYRGCRVVSPGELARSPVSAVVITVWNPLMVNEIKRQLEAYGIASYCHINEWLEVVV